MIRHYVPTWHEERIICRVGPPCLDLIIFNKREMVVSRFPVFAWWYTQLKVTFHWRTNRSQGPTKTRKEFLWTMINFTPHQQWWETKWRFGTKQPDSYISVLRISLLQWWVVQWRWSRLDKARWTKVMLDAKNRQTMDHKHNQLLR